MHATDKGTNRGTNKGTNVEIRAARQDEMDALDRLTGYAFANNEQRQEPEPSPLRAEQSLCAFDGDRMVASSGAFDFKMRFNGRTVPADGVTMVSADPGYRRRGIVRQLITGLLHRARRNGVPVSILWASMGAIYQRFGYGLGSSSVSYDIPRRYIAFQFGDRAPGTVRLLEHETALPLVQEIYRGYSGAANGMLHRAPEYWQIMLRREQGQHSYVGVYFDASDVPRGYCLYRTKWQEDGSFEPSQVMDVFDLAWLDMEAYRGLWEYFAGHDLVNRVRLTHVPEDDPAPNLFLEPRMLQRKVWDGIWLRIVDVEHALTARGYDYPGEAVIEVVEDDICDWNNGQYRITTGGDAVSVERVHGVREPDIVTRPDALASLLMGQARASDLARMERLTMAARDREAALDALFSTRRRPCCPNDF